MPKRKKLTEEEIQAEINRRVEEQLKIDREIAHVKEVESFIDDALDVLLRHYIYGDLKREYLFSTAISLIDNSGLSEETKELLRHNFASSIVFSRRGVKPEDWGTSMKIIDAIQKHLRGQI